ncbi:immunity protein YezG family protein [Shouchella lonarensis]|uniref:TIGR01741 family protein n=1 Tax=Shouchella lonarensis TaxID=1464122 RepID=A0A1G6H9W4_9BACI|nr:immunity protein YezG family protein [Shouchella lonarensis]SDB91001.1 Protein of unknown function, DUF600 [Shouchella lonarensis]
MKDRVEQYYQKLASLIVEMIPEDWTEIKFYAQEDEEGSQKYFFYYQSSKTQEWVYNMTITENFEFPEEEFDKLEDELSFCISDFKQDYQEEFGEVWTSFQMTLNSNGKFNIHFSYEENPFDSLLTHIAWQYENFGTTYEEDSFYQDLLEEYLEEKSQGKRYPFLEPIEKEE